jgi:hypothetical protein
MGCTHTGPPLTDRLLAGVLMRVPLPFSLQIDYPKLYNDNN